MLSLVGANMPRSWNRGHRTCFGLLAKYQHKRRERGLQVGGSIDLAHVFGAGGVLRCVLERYNCTPVGKGYGFDVAFAHC